MGQSCGPQIESLLHGTFNSALTAVRLIEAPSEDEPTRNINHIFKILSKQHFDYRLIDSLETVT